MIEIKRSKVYMPGFIIADHPAVTLEGTVIHKSGLITGGTGGSSRRFNDNDVLSQYLDLWLT
jgi:chromosome segregation ATPase